MAGACCRLIVEARDYRMIGAKKGAGENGQGRMLH